VSVAGLAFLAVTVAAVKLQLYLVWSLPLLLLLVILALSRIDIFYLLMLFFIPLSIQLRFIIEDPPADLFLPTEPMLAIILLIIFFRLFNNRDYISLPLRHPLSHIILAMLIWMFITAVTSVDPLVSFKVLATRIWFVAGLYFLSLQLFGDGRFIQKSFMLLVAGMIPVIIYNIAGLWKMGLFNQQAAHSTMWPFFNDHTSFGATLAFIIPFTFYLAAPASQLWRGVGWALLILILSAGLLFSYSRAAWLSTIPALLLAILLLLRVPWKIVIPTIAGLVVIVLLSWSSLAGFIQDNRQDSSADLASHIRSASNITTDASNLERINRWKAASRMIPERPFLGWGPGTYQFNYAPYQNFSERTIISTNFGDRGNAHSEYIGAAVDSGIPGTLLYLLLVGVALYRGIRFSINCTDRRDRLLIIAVLAGLVTYILHGFLNNFLDTDKISAPFWISMAIIVTLETKKGRENISTT